MKEENSTQGKFKYFYIAKGKSIKQRLNETYAQRGQKELELESLIYSK